MYVESGLRGVQFGLRRILHRNNAPPHKALSVKQFLAKSQLLRWNTRPVPLILLRMTSVSKNKVCFKGTKISGH
jgi:hypothetical protein